MDGAIGILGHAATHAAGVVGKDSAHHARINGGGVGSNAAAIWLEHIVNKSTDDARLEADQMPAVLHAVIIPMFGDVHENTICDSLARETRPCRSEGHGNFVLLCKFEKGLYFANRGWLHHRLWYKPKIRRVVGICDAVNQAGVNTRGREDSGKIGGKRHNRYYKTFENLELLKIFR